MKEASELTSENWHLSQPLPWQKCMMSVRQQSQASLFKGQSTDRPFPIESLIGPLVLVQDDMTFDYTVKHYFSTKHLPHSLHKMDDSALGIELDLAIRETTD